MWCRCWAAAPCWTYMPSLRKGPDAAGERSAAKAWTDSDDELRWR